MHLEIQVALQDEFIDNCVKYFSVTLKQCSTQQIDNGELKDLFTTGNASQAEPTVTRLSEDMLALGRDMMSIIIDSEGNPAKKYALTWSDYPQVLGKTGMKSE